VLTLSDTCLMMLGLIEVHLTCGHMGSRLLNVLVEN